jgi:hypothetical protein
MAKTEKRMDKTAIQKIPGVTGGFLSKYVEDNSLASLSEYVIVPRLKIIQAMSAQELKDKIGGEGFVCVRPGDQLVAEKIDATTGGSFLFVPQFFFNEWCLWADRRDKDSPRIIKRSYDPASDIAKNAANPDKRIEIYEGQERKRSEDQWKRSYVHHFCYAGVIYGDHALAGTSVVLSMERGEFGNGKQFNTAISMRRHALEDGSRVKVPLWAQVWELNAKFRDMGDRKWWGFDFKAPTGEGVAAIIRDDQEDEFQAEHLRLAELHENNKLRVDHAEGDETEGATPPPANSKY